MKEKRKKPRPWDREPSDVPDLIWGGVRGDDLTQGVSQQPYREPVTGMPAPVLDTPPFSL